MRPATGKDPSGPGMVIIQFLSVLWGNSPQNNPGKLALFSAHVKRTRCRLPLCGIVEHNA
ncbi:MAG: hypothetical protein AAGU11_20595 [Syntrophobacteraceae bacterium]